MVKKMLVIIFVLFCLVFFFAIQQNIYPSLINIGTRPHPSSLKLQHVQDIPLSGGADRLDYQSIDDKTNKLYISHLGSNVVHVFDLREQKIMKDIPLTSNPYGILAVPLLKEVFVSIGGKNQLAVIDENTLEVIKYISVGNTPDGIAYDPATKEIYVSNENGGTVSVISTKTNKRVVDIPIGGAVGNTHYFDKANKIYTVSGDENVLFEIDPLTNKVTQKYPLQGCTHAHGFYIDSQTHYAFITCDTNNVMLVFDLDAKKSIFLDTVGAGPDVLAYDEGLHHLYVAAESGVMTIFSVQKGNIKKLTEGFIAPHAHTVAVDPKTHLIYLPLENSNGKPILSMYRPYH
jgi:YVTN family beta-propeller protein